MITWSDTYATGVARIDAEHRQLVALLNELEEAVQLGRGSHAIGGIVARLCTYADRHFSHEERCMEQHRCPTAAANKQAHGAFKQMLERAKPRLAGGGGALAAQIVHRELCDWLVNHVLRVDTALRVCVRPAAA